MSEVRQRRWCVCISGVLLIAGLLLGLFLSPAAHATPLSSRAVVDSGYRAPTTAHSGCCVASAAAAALRRFNFLFGHCPSLVFTATDLIIQSVAAPAVAIAEASPSIVVLSFDPPPPKDDATMRS